MQPSQEGSQPPLPPQYTSPEGASSAVGWAPHEQQQVMPPLPPAGPAVPESWQQHASWAQAADAWSFAQASQWGHQAPHMAGGWSMPGQLGPQQIQYYQAGAGQPLPQQHQGGVIFLCDPRTEDECLQRGLFGLPATQTQIVRAIVPEATLLFLFNVRASERSELSRHGPAPCHSSLRQPVPANTRRLPSAVPPATCAPPRPRSA